MAIYQNSYEINRLFFHIVLIAICIPHVWILKLKYYDALETTINRYIEPKHSDWIATNANSRYVGKLFIFPKKK